MDGGGRCGAACRTSARVEALKTIPAKEHVALFTKHNVLTEHELKARTEIFLEVYSRQINVEALTMLSMARRQILPACCEYSRQLGRAVVAVSGAGVGADTQTRLLKRVCDLIATLEAGIEALDKARSKAAATKGHEQQAESYRNDVVPAMQVLRAAADEWKRSSTLAGRCHLPRCSSCAGWAP
jgi:glutamine synthetase